jgi:thiamine pyrophosphate-dependent acetolactate synthase large subunit-like protein
VPGEENAGLMMAIEDFNIGCILTRHEQGSAFVMECRGRLMGEPGVCLGTLGPGAANLVTGVADANMDRAPLIAITGQTRMGRSHKESYRAMDVVGMFTPITKKPGACPVIRAISSLPARGPSPSLVPVKVVVPIDYCEDALLTKRLDDLAIGLCTYRGRRTSSEPTPRLVPRLPEDVGGEGTEVQGALCLLESGTVLEGGMTHDTTG